MPGSECCEHCAGIPLLREEVAALRARLNALTTLPPSAAGPLPLQAEPGVAAKTPPRTFFSEPVAAADARAMGAALLYEAMALCGEMDMKSYDRFFPAQDYLPRRGFGNLIALPLEGRCRQNRTTLFADPATFEPYQDQFAYLSSLERRTRRDVVERAEELQPPTVGPAVRPHRSPLAAELRRRTSSKLS